MEDKGRARLGLVVMGLVIFATLFVLAHRERAYAGDPVEHTSYIRAGQTIATIDDTTGDIVNVTLSDYYPNNNLKVGQKIVISGTSAYNGTFTISSVTDQKTFAYSDADTTRAQETTGTAGGNYATLTEWEAGVQGVLTTGDGTVEIAECYNDWPFGLDDNVTIDSSTTSATCYLKITAPESERHNGKAGTGFRINPTSDGSPITVSDNYTVVEYVEITNWTGAGNEGVEVSGSATNNTLRYLLIHDGLVGVASATAADSFTIYDSTVYNITGGIGIDSAGSDAIYNCTVYSCSSHGIDLNSNTTIKNTYSGSATSSDFNGTPGTYSNNASSDTTEPGGTNTNKAASDQFVDLTAGYEDFHLKATAFLKDQGADLSSTFGDDIEGVYRSETATTSYWDIGASEHHLVWGGGEWLDGWDYRKKITIDNTYVNSDLTDFPLYVYFDDATIHSHLSDQTNATDVRFTHKDGTTPLHYEREYYDGTSKGYFWVRVPHIESSTTTDIYIYYNNSGAEDGSDPDAVWDANYVGVWHMNENQIAGGVQDSSGGGHTLTNSGTDDIAGKISQGRDFIDANNDYMEAAHSDDWIVDDFTISMWLNNDDKTNNCYLFYHYDSVELDGIQIRVDTSKYREQVYVSGQTTTTTLSDNDAGETWEYMHFTRSSGDTIYMYRNSTLQADDADNISGTIDSTDKLWFGTILNAGSDWYDGLMDEVRFSNVARTAPWIKFEYYNIMESDHEITLDTEEQPPTTTSGNTNYSTAANWGGTAPAANDVVVFNDSYTTNCTIDASAVSASLESLQMLSGYTGTVTAGSGGTHKAITTTGDVVINAGTLAHGDNSTAETYKLELTASGDFTLGAGGEIDVTELGYDGDNGPGAPTPGTTDGGAYGGVGGDNGANGSTSSTYGSITAPTNLGSGSDYAVLGGGGAVILNVSGTTVINGTISSNAVSEYWGGSSGGSIYITTGTISGGGTIQANGGASFSNGAGGGGRVAVILTSGNSFDSVAITAYGGDATQANEDGAAGTVYKQTATQGSGGGDLIIDNPAGRSVASGVVTDLNGNAAASETVGTIETANTAKFQIGSNDTLTLGGTGTTITIGSGTTLDNDGTFSIGGTIFDNNGTITTDNSASTVIYTGQADDSAVTMLDLTYHDLTVSNDGTTFSLPAALDTTGDVTITAGTLDSNTYDINLEGNWDCDGSFTCGTKTVEFDGTDQAVDGSATFYNFTKSITSTDTLTFEAGGTQTIASGGKLTFDGFDGSNYLFLRSSSAGNYWYLTANGSFAIDYVDVKDSDASGGTTISHSNSVSSGHNVNWGFGTTYTWDGDADPDFSWTNALNWTADSGYPDTNNEKALFNATSDNVTIPANTTLGELELASGYGGTLTLNGTLTLDDIQDFGGDFTIAAGTLDVSGSNYQINIDGNWAKTGGTFTSQNGTVDFTKSANTQTLNSGGTGVGDYFWHLKHSGAGTLELSTNALRITGDFTNSAGTFDAKGKDITAARDWDSTGGNFISGDNTVNFTNNSKTVTTGGTEDNHDFNNVAVVLGDSSRDFVVSTNDMDIDGNLTLTSGRLQPSTNITLAGNLTISSTDVGAEIGTGDLIFDGGSLQTITNSVGETEAVAEVQVSNAAGVQLDNDITFTICDVNSGGLLIFPNGTDADLDVTTSGLIVDGTVRVDGSHTITGDVTVQTGGSIVHSENSTAETYKIDLTVDGELDVQAGGTIDVDGLGYDREAGPGAGGAGTYDGGGYGGIGGNYDGAITSSTYGSITAPTNLGSGGDARDGGGAVILNVTGTTTVSGTISANGETGWAGPGSGGSLYLTTATLSGSGTIRADGGDYGASKPAGGGGRVAIILTSGNNFGSVVITAYGGDSGTANMDGAAGTVYKQTATQGSNGGDLIIDNPAGRSVASGVITDLNGNAAASVTVGTIETANTAKFQIGSNDTLTLAGTGTTITIGSGTTLDNDGTFSIGGTIFDNNGTITTDNSASTVIYTGQADNSAVTMLDLTYYNLQVNNDGTTFSLANDLDTAGNITITAGTLDSNSYDINLEGNWDCDGSFTYGTKTVTFDGTTQFVSGSATFYNFVKTITSTDTLTFDNTGTQTIASGGTLTLQGVAGELLVLRSDSTGNQWGLTVNGSSEVNCVDVKDSDATGGATIFAGGSTDSTNNDNWIFDPDWLAGWGYRKKISIDPTYVDSNLENFPLYVYFSDTDIESNARADGYDIRFTNADGKTTLSQEMENYASGVGHFWVKVPTISSSDTTDIYLYYGKSDETSDPSSTATWDDYFEGVWHLGDDDADTAVEDSTAGNHDGTKLANAEPTQTSGLIGNCQRFDGTNDKITFPDMTDHFGDEEGTVEMFLKIDTDPPASGNQSGLGVWGTSALISHYPFTSGTIYLETLRDDRITVDDGLIADLTAWHHLAITNKNGANNWIVYQNAAVADTDAGEAASYLPTAPILGDSVGAVLDGDVCELRLSSTARSAAWLKFTYRNIANGDHEIELDTEESPTYEKTWDGSASAVWATADNWTPSGAPSSTDDVLIPSSAEYTNAPTISSATTIKTLTVYGGATLTFDGDGSVSLLNTTGDTTIYGGATLTHDDNTTTEEHKLNMNVGGNLEIKLGGEIDVTGLGYDAGEGTGAAGDRDGGSYGGTGGIYSDDETGPTYGSITAPTNLGSGGYTYPGGGAVILSVTGTSTVNGIISADGSGTESNGSGGSIYLTTGTISGSGTIQANGGDASGGYAAGGGGRVAVVLTSGNNFGSVNITAYGGEGPSATRDGAAGTVYKQTATQGSGGGDLIIDNPAGRSVASGVVTDINSSCTDTTVGDLTIENTGELQVGSGGSLTLAGDTWTGVTSSNMTADDASTITYTGDTTVNLINLTSYGNLVVNNGSTTFNLPADTDVNGNLTITTGILDAVSGSNYDINLAGDWSCSGTFQPRNGAVTFDSTTQSVSGSATFYNLTKTVTSEDTLTFDNTGTQTIAAGGTLTLQGQSMNLLNLRSDSSPAQWGLKVNGTCSIDYVDVKDSDASAGDTITHTNAINSGNNDNWGFTGVSSPNGGETWAEGEEHDITWQGDGQGNVMIQISTDGGTTWTTIVSSTPDDGIHPWEVPGTASTSAKIRIVPLDLTIGGTASGKVSSGVSYESNDKILYIDVTSDFTSGEYITVADAAFSDFTAVSDWDHLELDIYGAGNPYAMDDKYIAIGSAANASFFGGGGDGWDFAESAELLLE